MVRIFQNGDGVTMLIPGAREKGVISPYREPTQVPLAEEVKAGIVTGKQIGRAHV